MMYIDVLVCVDVFMIVWTFIHRFTCKQTAASRCVHVGVCVCA